MKEVYCKHNWECLEIKGFFGNTILDYFRCKICESFWIYSIKYKRVYQEEPKKVIGYIDDKKVAIK